ncbi:winged helix-turn-helix domain-containing protein [Bacillus sp. FJAT-49705]|uniref:Winged helix-turn-helix domain-containing protein n=1 Tax=Cytobacillus citreus TaxID=2833586 RepID=A0ABS5NNQ6_9BACI|nr:winged helix-turn-helix domain-containing protein [Cytobacillus citreus]
MEPNLTLCGVSRLLHDLGLSYTKPTYTLAKADLVKQKEFIEDSFPSYKITHK